jgi:hypothetical protein
LALIEGEAGSLNSEIEAHYDELNVVRLSDVTPETVSWLWPGYIPLGKLSVLEGDPGLGKSTLALSIAAAVSRGRGLPGRLECDPADVVLVSYEDGLADTIRPRLDAARADVHRVHAVQGITHAGTHDETLISFPTDSESVFDLVSELGAQLVIVDPLSAALAGQIDSYKDADIRRVLAPMARFAEDSGAAVLVVRHLTKSGRRAITAGGGSIAIAAAARVVLAVHQDPDRPDDAGSRVLAPVKCNLSSKPASLAFHLTSEATGAVRVEWSGESSHTADTLSSLRDDFENGASEREMDEWLRAVLSEGPQTRKEVFRQAKGAAFSERSLDRAATRLRVKRIQSGFGKEKCSEWSL